MTKTILNHHGIPLKMENTENVVRFTTIFPGSNNAGAALGLYINWWYGGFNLRLIEKFDRKLTFSCYIGCIIYQKWKDIEWNKNTNF